MLALVETDIVEDEELCLGSEERGISHARRGQIHFGLLGDVARIAVVALLGHGIDDVSNQDQRWRLGEGIHDEPVRIGDQEHVALVNGRPAPNRRAIHAEAVFEGRLLELLNGIGNVVPQSRKIGEAQVEHARAVLLGKLQDCFSVGHPVLPLQSVLPRLALRFQPSRIAAWAVKWEIASVYGCDNRTSVPLVRVAVGGAPATTRGDSSKIACLLPGCGILNGGTRYSNTALWTLTSSRPSWK